MESPVNELVVQLALVFIPGLVWLAIVDKLAYAAKRSALMMVLRAYGFGLISYFAWFTIYYPYFRIRYCVWPKIFGNGNEPIGVSYLKLLRPKDVFFTSVVAFVLA